MEESLKPIFQQFYADYDHVSMGITAYGVATVREPEPWPVGVGQTSRLFAMSSSRELSARYQER